jgi:trehalose 6-phosphate synthase
MRAADVRAVGSLHDGLNPVAKEFVRARTDERGVLILSRPAYAARDFTALTPIRLITVAAHLGCAADDRRRASDAQRKAAGSVVAEFSTAGRNADGRAMTELGHRSEPVW